MASPSLLSGIISVLQSEGEQVPKEKILAILQKERLEEECGKELNSVAGELHIPDDSDQINKSKVLWSVKEMAISLPDEENDDVGGDGDGEKPKKKKSKREALMSKKNRTDPHAPAVSRIPLPELRDAEKQDRIIASREAAKRLRLGPNSLPSICFYTLLNGHHHHYSAAICAQISEDSGLLAAGFSDSMIRVWSLTPNKLKKMKPSTELENIDKDSDDVLYRIMDEKNATEVNILRGHNGPVYAVHFSPDRNLLLSCSEDTTIRLWSLQTWTNICCYKGHCYPVWDVKFSPHGYYFASVSHDRTARFWATDQHQPLRMFVGNVLDVECVEIHPNSNYVATGSSDNTVRLWDVLNGSCVRLFKGHKSRPNVLTFSHDGRFLISGGADKSIIVWDIPNAVIVGRLNGHHDCIYSLCFSRDGTVLASGGADDCVMIWDFKRMTQEFDPDDPNTAKVPVMR